MFANRRRFRDAVASNLTPSEAWLYVETIFVLKLPYPRWMVLSFLDRAAETDPVAAAYAKVIRSRRRVEVRIKTVEAKVLAGDALTLARTERDLQNDPDLKQAVDRFDRSPNPE